MCHSVPASRPAAVALLLVLVCLAPSAVAEGEKAGAGPTDEDCLTCHTDPSTNRADGKPVLVDAAKWKGSIHGEVSVACTDCHADLANAEMPHPDKLKPAQCVSCHEKAVPAYAKSFHALPRKDGKGPSAKCAGCHGEPHGILASGDRRSPTHTLNIVSTCAKCHDDPKLMESVNHKRDVVESFVDSIHGRAISEAGLVVAPTCASCHGFHDIVKANTPDSRVGRAHQAETCGTCHVGIIEQYGKGIHAAEVAKGNAKAPVCSDCHSAHGIQRAETSWALDVIGECGTCHEESLRSYRDTFHGHVTELGFTRMAKCADCHGKHDIVGKEDPRSRVAAANLVATCRQCHADATASFVKYDPHANPSDKKRSPVLYYTGLLMKLLLAGVFGFFGLHTVLWLVRALAEKARRPKGGQ